MLVCMNVILYLAIHGSLLSEHPHFFKNMYECNALIFSVPRQSDRRLHRTWFNASEGKQSAKKFDVIAYCSVMSYNILSQVC